MYFDYARYLLMEGNNSEENPVGSFPSREADKKHGSTSEIHDAITNALTMFRKHLKLTKHSELK